jgi:hypothetical protein
MNVKPPSKKLVEINDKLSSLPLKRLLVEKVRAQVIEHQAESKSEIVRSGQFLKRR